MKKLLAFLLMFTLTACATVQHGPVQRIAVDSEPQGAVVRTAHCGPGATKEVRTPGELWVSRRAEHCTLTFTARDHYAEQVTLHREMAPEFFENADAAAVVLDEGPGEWLPWFVFGTVLAGTGFAVDTATGALFEQHPREVFVNLEPVQPEAQEQASNQR
ncbi:MAG TPA: hypothetical protein VM733_17595 [Thermoanaerobaculia bacterium]|nr:hypothetical protein [Thermoanaerobaculia bacterium]